MPLRGDRSQNATTRRRDSPFASTAHAARSLHARAVVINTQGKGLFKDVKNVAGNFSWCVGLNVPLAKPAPEMSMADWLSHFKALGNTWRDPQQSAAIVEGYVGANRLMDLNGGVASSGKYDLLSAFLHYGVNNQMVYPSAQIRFGRGAVIGYTPWHSATQIHIVAAAENPSGTAPAGDGPVEATPKARPKPQRQGSLIKRVVGALDPRAAFDEADSDSSGSVSREELFRVLRDQAKVSVDPAEMEELFYLFDKDGSGDIDAKEFEAAFYAMRLAGGVDVYVPLSSSKQVAHVEGPAFKESLLHGWRDGMKKELI